MANWILCDDHMPEKDVVVWVTIAGSDIVIPQDGESITDCLKRLHKQIRRVKAGFFSDEGWCDTDGWPMIVRPIAWMPYTQPEPYLGDLSHDDMEKFWHEKDFFESEPFDE